MKPLPDIQIVKHFNVRDLSQVLANPNLYSSLMKGKAVHIDRSQEHLSVRRIDQVSLPKIIKRINNKTFSTMSIRLDTEGMIEIPDYNIPNPVDYLQNHTRAMGLGYVDNVNHWLNSIHYIYCGVVLYHNTFDHNAFLYIAGSQEDPSHIAALTQLLFTVSQFPNTSVRVVLPFDSDNWNEVIRGLLHLLKAKATASSLFVYSTNYLDQIFVSFLNAGNESVPLDEIYFSGIDWRATDNNEEPLSTEG